MRNITLKILVFFCITSSFSQKLTADAVVGTWTVSKVVTTAVDIPEEEIQFMQEMTTAFEAATFQFYANKRFTLEIAIEELAINLKDIFWKLNTTNDKILLQESDDAPSEKSLFVISTAQKDGQYTFELSRMPFIMAVQKKIK